MSGAYAETGPANGYTPGHAGVAGADGPSIVYLVDDDELVRRSLSSLLRVLGYQVRSFGTAEDLLGVLDGLEPGCVIMDVCLPGMDGLELQRELAARDARFPVIVLTGHADVAVAVQAMKAGAVDLLQKPFTSAELLPVVETALARMRESRRQQDVAQQASDRIAGLTPRERDVLARLIEGRQNKMIAHELGISPRTVEIHRANVMDKLGCRSLAEVVRIAVAARYGSLALV